ncbi:unnamed protein product, partial [marine sediment metagenome]
KIKIKRKKFIALFLVFSLIAINCSTLKNIEKKREKRKKHGAVLLIKKKNSSQIRGELIVVKINQKTLLLLDSRTGTDVTIDIKDAKVITIVKKSNILLSAFMGIPIGASIGVLSQTLKHTGEAIGESKFLWSLSPFVFMYCLSYSFSHPSNELGIGGVVGALFGASVGAVAGKDKIIQIEGKSEIEKIKILEKLRKKARIPDYK